MTFSDTEMKELGRGTAYNTHNITSLIRTPQVCIRHLADGRSLHGRRVYTHTHTHTMESNDLPAKLTLPTHPRSSLLINLMLIFFI